MKAAQRLYLTADRTALVAEGHKLASGLYAVPGDEIPDSAAKLFGLVDGKLPKGAKVEGEPAAELVDAVAPPTMIAAERLYLTAERDRLVGEGHELAVTLYCSPGDEIPDSAAQLFGLVDGRLGDDAGRVSRVAILRIATVDGGPPVEVALINFGPEAREILSGQIDEGQLLEILESEQLHVEIPLIGDDATGWVDFPGRNEAIELLKPRIAEDVAEGRAHAKVEVRAPEEAPKAAAAPKSPKAPAKAKGGKAKAGAKEHAPGQDKEHKGGDDKGGKAPNPDAPATVAEPADPAETNGQVEAGA